MSDLIREDKFYLEYYSFLNESPTKIIEDEFYLSEGSYHAESYYYCHREEFTKIVLSLINVSFKKKVFQKDDFFIFLENECYGFAGISIMEKNLIHQIQMDVDYFVTSKYSFFIKGNDFYKKYNPFRSIREFHYFIIKSILKNIQFNPYIADFYNKNY